MGLILTTYQSWDDPPRKDHPLCLVGWTPGKKRFGCWRSAVFFGPWRAKTSGDFVFFGGQKVIMATIRENPGLKVKLIVGPTCKIPRSTQRSCSGIRRSPKMCQVMVSKPLTSHPNSLGERRRLRVKHPAP